MIEFRTLGHLSLTDAGGREIRGLLTQPRRIALLAYLAIATRGGVHPRDRLLALFWPELDQARARAALRQALHVLRGAIGPDAIVTRGDDLIGLDLAVVRCDITAFDEAVAAGRDAEALDLYRGDLLEAFFVSDAPEFEHWLDGERARLRQAVVRCARRLVDEAEASGDLARGTYWARRALRLVPLDEGLVARLVALLDRLGDRAGAVQAYGDFAQRLARDLDVEPSAETQKLIAAVRTRARSAATDPREGAATDAAPARGAGEASPEAPASAPRTRTWRPAPRLALTGTAVALAAAAAIALGLPLRHRAPSGERVRTIAVMPLRASGDSQAMRYAEDMTEALTADLGRIRGLRVLSYAAVTSANGAARPLSDLAQHLRLDAVIEGGVQLSGDSARVDLAVVDPASGVETWTIPPIRESRERRFVIEDTAGQRVAAALQLPATPSQRPLHAQPTGNGAAYELLLRGRIRMRVESREADSTAITLLERAVALDPSFAVAWAQLARACALRVAQFAHDDSAARDRAYVAVARSLQLDSGLAEGHWANAALLWGISGAFPHARAMREVRRALALDPNLADAHHLLGQIYLHVGLLDSALAEFHAALALNPFDDNAQRRVGATLLYLGRPADALSELLQAAPQSNEPLWNLFVAAARIALSRDAEAERQIEGALREHPEDRGGVIHSTRAILRARRGDRRGAEDDIRLAVAAGRGFTHFHHSAYNIAAAYAILGQADRALVWLRLAAEKGFPCYPCFRDDRNLANLRTQPGFRLFLQDLKAEWERYRTL